MLLGILDELLNLTFLATDTFLDLYHSAGDLRPRIVEGLFLVTAH
jgi:hypothetical protein